MKVEKGLAVLDLLDLAVVPVALDPCIRDSLEFLGIFFVLSVKGMVVIIFTGAGNQFLEDLFPVFCNREFFKKPKWGSF